MSKSPKVPPVFIKFYLMAIEHASGYDEGVELIYESIDQMLSEGSFEIVDAILASIVTKNLSTTQLLAFMSITSAAREKLLARADYCSRVRTDLTSTSPHRVEVLLRGLE